MEAYYNPKLFANNLNYSNSMSYTFLNTFYPSTLKSQSTCLDSFRRMDFEDFQEEKANIILVFSGSETETIIPDVRVKVIDGCQVDLSDLMKSLIFMQHPVEGMEVYTYNYKAHAHILRGKDPLPAHTRVSLKELVKSNGRLQIEILVKQPPVPQILAPQLHVPQNTIPQHMILTPEQTANTLPDEKMVPEAEDIVSTLEPEESRESLSDFAIPNAKSSLLKNKRTKEKKIKDVVALVKEWRKPYEIGVPDEQGNLVKLSLEDSAKRLGMSKKSLDDYLLQIRGGKKYKFDFDKRGEEGVGVLRAFVKKAKTSKDQVSTTAQNSTNADEEDFLLRKKEAKQQKKKVTFALQGSTLSTRSKKISK